MLIERGKAMLGISTAPTWPLVGNELLIPCCQRKADENKVLQLTVEFFQAEMWLCENEVHERKDYVCYLEDTNKFARADYDRRFAELAEAEKRAKN